jgi:hypothetical protein
LTVHEWEKARTDRVTLRAIAPPDVDRLTAAAR